MIYQDIYDCSCWASLLFIYNINLNVLQIHDFTGFTQLIENQSKRKRVTIVLILIFGVSTKTEFIARNSPENFHIILTDLT